ncbi:mitochondrial fission ELM1-domain-containing protein [Parasitella parasitica]|nr:mitochondrial fission ELM1-domain-containing protein [Parasitella parasitica]
MFPAIVQKYIIEWSAPKNKGALNTLPWYLTAKDESFDETKPDYVITSGQDAVPACLHLTRLQQDKKCFSVFVGYPNIPFVNFDQVVLPKYEANAKMAALGPLAKQKNGIITPAPLLDTTTTSYKQIDQMIPTSFSQGYTTVVVGGHSPNCRWYSEDAANLADNIKRMVKNLGDKVVVIYTDRTPQLVKDTMNKRFGEFGSMHSSVIAWDSTLEGSTSNKLTRYENIIHYSRRIVLTADLDYACAHAISKGKPVYVTFGGQCRSYLAHFYRWIYDAHLARKLRLERHNHKSTVHDPYSYLGNHVTWGNASKVFQMKHSMSFVKCEIEGIRSEKISGKRARD